jgi:tRNA threonylcarbamoyladenosine biosynthesis protein TsaE
MTSPTFTYMQEYDGTAQGQPTRLIHMDLYRLQHPEEVEAIGIEDAFQNDAICLIEWPEIAVDYLPKERLELRIEGSGEEPRKLSFFPFSQNWQERMLNIWENLSSAI